MTLRNADDIILEFSRKIYDHAMVWIRLAPFVSTSMSLIIIETLKTKSK